METFHNISGKFFGSFWLPYVGLTRGNHLSWGRHLLPLVCMGDMSLSNTVEPIRYVLSLTLTLRYQVKIIQLSPGDVGVVIQILLDHALSKHSDIILWAD